MSVDIYTTNRIITMFSNKLFLLFMMWPMFHFVAGTKSLYKVHKSPATFFDANRTCVNEGATLFYPETANESEAVLSLLTNNVGITLPYYLHVGLQSKGFNLKTLNGTFVDTRFMRWLKWYPSSNVNRKCVRMTYPLNGKIILQSVQCYVTMPFICKSNYVEDNQELISEKSYDWEWTTYAHADASSWDDESTTTADMTGTDTPDTASTSNPEEYNIIAGTKSLYKVHKSPATFFDANRTCINEGATLFYPETSNESEAVLSFVTHNFEISLPYYLHVGLQSKGFALKTLNGTFVDTRFMRWLKWYPSSNVNRKCVRMTYPLNGKILLQNVQCYITMPFICRKLSDFNSEYKEDKQESRSLKSHDWESTTHEQSDANSWGDESTTTADSSSSYDESTTNSDSGDDESTTISDSNSTYDKSTTNSDSGDDESTTISDSNSPYDESTTNSDSRDDESTTISGRVSIETEDREKTRALKSRYYFYVPQTKALYKIYLTAATFNDAKTICEADGASLYYPENEHESNTVTMYMQKHKGANNAYGWYIGLVRSGNNFVPSNGTTVSNTYVNWNIGEPNNAGGSENCVVFIIDPRKMNDVPCTYQFYYICKWQPSLSFKNWAADFSSSTDSTYWNNEYTETTPKDSSYRNNEYTETTPEDSSFLYISTTNSDTWYDESTITLDSWNDKSAITSDSNSTYDKSTTNSDSGDDESTTISDSNSPYDESTTNSDSRDDESTTISGRVSIETEDREKTRALKSRYYFYVPQTKALYKIYLTAATFNDAKTICEADGASLYYPENEHESNTVTMYMQKHKGANNAYGWYIGLVRSGNNFVPSNGTTVSNTYVNWNIGEPNNAGGSENCVVFIIDPRKMNDVPCTYQFYYICKWQPSLSFKNWAADFSSSTDSTYWNNEYTETTPKDSSYRNNEYTETTPEDSSFLYISTTNSDTWYDESTITLDSWNDKSAITSDSRDFESTTSSDVYLETTISPVIQIINKTNVETTTHFSTNKTKYVKPNNSTVATPIKSNEKDYNFIPGTKSIYKLHKTALNFTAAENICKSEGSMLFYPDTEKEIQVVLGFLKNNFGIDFPYNLHVGQQSKDYVTNNSAMDNVFLQENTDEYDNKCISMTFLPNATTIFNINPCFSLRPFVCKIRISGWNDVCNVTNEGYGYAEQLGKCYKFHLTPRNWTDARLQCRAENAELAVINSREEVAYLVRLTSSIPKMRIPNSFPHGVVLLGFHNIDVKDWQTIQGTSLYHSGYACWGNSQPDGGDRDRCGSMFYNGHLNDIACDQKAFFICEHNVANYEHEPPPQFSAQQSLKCYDDI